MKQYLKINTKKFIEKEIKNLKDYIDLIIDNSLRALEEAKMLMDRRLNKMNNIREQLTEQAATFVTEDEKKLLEQKIDSLSKLVYIGFGVFLMLEIILIFVLNIIYKK
jgi:hypothetical protein